MLAMEDYIREIRKQAIHFEYVEFNVIQNVPVGLGEPVFDKTQRWVSGALHKCSKVLNTGVDLKS
jgi:chorismate synthase